MKTIRMFKMPFATKHFNANQRVWVVFLSGDEAAECVGKFHGKGRYVSAWVNWRAKNKPSPELKEIEVSQGFYDRIMGV